MKKALTLSLVTLLLLSCSGSKLYYSSDASDWKLSSPGKEKELIYEIFLIGDAGSASLEKQEPNLKLLKQKLSESTENSSVVFLGDNIYLNGLPDTTDCDRHTN